ncbi:MAG TPA: CHAT domain-containing protein [Pyrinomonadaceae bacterium]|nr:CHAT domain-containing protein [Pyrinomonadaceae bacterium]
MSVLRKAGAIHLNLGEFELARTSFDEALTLARAVRDSALEAETLTDLSLALLYLGQVEEASNAAQTAVSLSQTLNNTGIKARALTNKGIVDYLRGNWQLGMTSFEQAMPLAKAAGDTATTAQLCLHIGYTYADTGDYEKAVNHYAEALTLWRAAGDRAGEAATVSSMGLAHAILGDSQKAIDALEGQALVLSRQIGDRFGEAAAHNNLGFVYQTLGDLDQSLKHYRLGLEIYDRIQLVAGQALTVQYVGYILDLQGNKQEALACYERGVKFSQLAKNQIMEADALNYIGSIYSGLDKPQEANRYFQQALTVYRAAGQQRGQAAVLINIGKYFDSIDQPQKALQNYNEALAIFRLVGDRAGQVSALYNVARSLRDTSDLEQAQKAIEEVIAINEAVRFKVSSNDLRAAYFASVHHQFELYVDILMSRNAARDNGESAFEAYERGRARSLLEALVEARADIKKGVDTGLLQRERLLQRQINAKAEKRIQLASEQAAAGSLTALDQELSDLASDYKQIQGQIRASSPRYAALTQPAPLKLKDIQRQVLDENTVLLEYGLGETRSFGWFVTPDTIKSFELPAREAIETKARRVYELLTARNRTENSSLPPSINRIELEYANEAAELSRMLLGPVLSELKNKRLVVVADGALQFVPFAALPVPRVQDGLVPLIVEHEVVSLPSASVLALIRDEVRGRSPAPKSIAILADPVFDKYDERIMKRATLKEFNGIRQGEALGRLPFSRREAEAIMTSAATRDGMLALGFRASRTTATSGELSRYRIVHFATHGILNTQYPELSGILLSRFDEKGQPQDGFLQLHEIYNLDLPCELVVLSACQTALGKEIKGEGFVGLTRGFMYAGAARVVASLWKVDDAATAELMKSFYQSMFDDKLSPAAALRAAQINLWKQSAWRSPYYWAAFTLQGEWR